MKNHYFFRQALAAILFFASALTTNASHLVGAYMWYEHVSGNTYNMHLRYYRDCAGIPAATQVTLCVTSVSQGIMFQKMLPNVSSIQAPVNSCAPIGTTTCNGGTDYGVQEYTYADTITLPTQANDWLFDYEECCRNAALTTIAGGPGLYTFCTLDNLTFGANNSPVFPNAFIGLYCAGILTNIDYSTTDIDGDSIVYSLVNAEDATGVCPYLPAPVTYVAPYSYNNPLASFSPITLNSSTGYFSFTPAIIQVGEVAILVEEYRNGIKIGSVKRDDQIVIVNGITNPDIVEGTVFVDMNNNGIQDAGDFGLAGQMITVSPSNIVSTSDSTGHYHIEVIPGTYTLSISNPPQWYTAAPSSYTIPFAALGQFSTGNDFALSSSVNITDLSVSIANSHLVRPGHQTTFTIHVTNEGTNATGGTLTFHHDLNYNYISSTPVYDTYTIPDMAWNLPTLNPFQSITYIVTMEADSTLTIGDTLLYSATVATSVTDNDMSDNTWNGNQLVVLSIDPNYISVSPDGPVNTTFVSQGGWLYYTINFQNTGIAAAINVDVKNGIDFNADVSTMEFVASSHPCIYSVSGIGLADFNFQNINLPDWNTDEPGSHGYILYRIKTKPTLQPGDYILNAASIYFDANPAITTNTVRTDIISSPTGITTVSLGNASIQIFPNPANEIINIVIPEKKNFKFEVNDLLGKNILQKNISTSAEVNIHKLSTGIYIYKFTAVDGKTATGKLIKN
jgi:uncharacterized repeat protein (TIGR01451 family)